MNVNGIDWHHPLEVPVVEMGTEKEFWIAVYSEHSKRQHVFLAHYQNRPLCYDDDGDLIENDWNLDCYGEAIESVGWVEHNRHSEYDNFYEPLGFNDEYRLLGWAEYEPPRFVAVDMDETPDVGVVFNYDPDLEKPELPISKFKICQLKMCGAIAAELSRQCPGITTEQSQMGTIIKAADLVCDAVNNQMQTDQCNSKENNTIKAEAVMYFANTLIGAFETGFIDEHKSDLADLHNSARAHVKINYQYEAKNLVEEWGENLAELCKNGDPVETTKTQTVIGTVKGDLNIEL